jgi:hypothetical protein
VPARTRALFARLKETGALKLRGQLDLSLMLHAATQPDSKLDFSIRTVTLVFTANAPLRLEARGAAKAERINRAARLVVSVKPDRWIPFELTAESGVDVESSLDAHWFTAEDARRVRWRCAACSFRGRNRRRRA